ncbi:dipeptide/oligopeptide/nickel ABC transporter permease/ATP-binding protein [Microbacterium karelineae]|uniref:dipeptide/oligopeptide/nickel ABC transporter permease/ATP-binding protein n=1 Tax=Microbacterium karelineae TaxID=2654283 RepID=UPI0012EA9CB2|nr:dipeptide/oligopeptide/nickel ABC transporter permease/ATP-binding protein [Microbacterium karelineae]
MSATYTTTLAQRPREPHRRSNVGRIVGRLVRQPATLVSAGFIVLLVLVAIGAPLFAPYAPTDSSLQNILTPPNDTFPLGTDDLGHDQLTLLLFGTRVVLTVAVGAVLVAAIVGVPVGLVLGFYGGWWDRIGMRFVDLAQALPGMLIGIAIVAIFGRNIFVLMVAIGLIFASGFTRMVRATVLAEREKAYVEAAAVSGLTNPQLIFGQIVPNLVGPMVTQGAVFFGSAIMIESAMSFLGVGLSGDVPSWGSMLSLAVANINAAPHLTWPPGIAIVLTVLAFNTFGDGFNDAMTGERRRTPRTRRAVAPAPASAANPAETAALSAEEVTVTLHKPGEGEVDIVRDASVRVARGEIVGLLGESGSGKSTLARAILGMLPGGVWQSGGSVWIDGEQTSRLSAAQMRRFRGNRIAAVFQDPMTALSPVHTVGQQLVEPLRIHKGMSRKQARIRAVELLDRVGVKNAADRLDHYPHQFSGGMAQRVAIAMALAADPDVLVADEATSALDVTTQAQVLDLLLDLRDEYGMGVLMITHSLGVVAEACDRAAVMYRGRIVEDAPVEQLFDDPQHPYTRALLAANPADAVGARRLPTIDTAMRAEIDAAVDADRLAEVAR